MKTALAAFLKRLKSLRRFLPATESLVMLLVLALAVAAIPALYYFPKWHADTYFRLVQNGGRVALRLDKDYFDVENESRKTLAQIVLGVFGLVAVYLTWVRSRAQDLQARVAQQGHFTDRFTRAIEQIGAVHDDGKPKIEVRLGAIYALERLARDSEKDHWTIIEILCAYVRENAQWVEGLPKAPEGAPAVRPRTDVQAALTVIGRRERSEQRETRNGAKLPLDLRGTDLRGADLEKAHLEGAYLNDAHLNGAVLSEAHFERAYLIQAHLEDAYLNYADLEGAHLSEAHLEGAHLSDAHLEGAFLSAAHLERARLFQAHLEDAELYGAHLEGAFLLEAHLEGAFLHGARMQDCRVVDEPGSENELTVQQVKSAVGWEKAHWSPEAAAKLGLPEPKPVIEQ